MGCGGNTAVISAKHPLVTFMAAHKLDFAHDTISEAEYDGYADCPQLMMNLSESQMDAYWAGCSLIVSLIV